MKNISISALLIALLIIVGCSKDDASSNQNTSSDSSFFQREVGSDISDFLTTFYNAEFTFGESVETSDDKNTYVVTEVYVDGSSTARGYVVAEKYTDKLLYFADVDRENYVLKVNNFVNNDTDEFHDIDKLSNYSSSDGFDILKMVKDANANPTGKLGRFWGWSCGYDYTVGGSCMRDCCYRVVWAQTSCDVFTCSNLPGSNPALP